MENPLEFTSIHIGLPNYSNCVLFFDKPIDEALLSALPTDYRKILFSSIYNFKLFNTDNIAIINRNILDEMMDDNETAYNKLFDPELLKKPVRKGNKIGGNKNGNMAKYKSNRLDLEWLYKYLKEALEATTYLIEANYFYRKNVLRLDNIGDTIDYYMNSAYFMKSDMYYYRIMLNKLMEQIMNDIRNMNTSEFKIDKSIEKIIEILAIE